jgi:membrane-associated phospholipid phosphatase
MALLLTLALVAASGIRLDVNWWSVARISLFFGALLWAWQRRSPSGGDERLRLYAGTLFVLFSALTLNAMLCFAGQTLALPLIDPMLARADHMLGFDVKWFVRVVCDIPGAPQLLAAVYYSSFPVLLVSALALAALGRTEDAWVLCIVFSLCLFVTVVASVILPAAGAFHYLQVPADVQGQLPDGSGIYHLKLLFALRDAEHLIVDPTRMAGVATFPSFHTAMALMTAAAWKGFRKIWILMMILQGLVIISTIPIGGHYLIDLAAGALCWAAAARLSYFVARSRSSVDVPCSEPSTSHAYV